MERSFVSRMVNELHKIHSYHAGKASSLHPHTEQVSTARNWAMDTHVSIYSSEASSEPAIGAAWEELGRLEGLLSRFVNDSDVWKINQSAGQHPVGISPETWEILTQAVVLSERTMGLFDITVAPLVDLWNVKHAVEVPSKRRIEREKRSVGFGGLSLDAEGKTAFLKDPGQAIDLGGIGKGFAADRCIGMLQSYGMHAGVVDLGGNVAILGNKADSQPWRVGLRHPRVHGCLIGAIEVNQGAVVTSGDYERYFIDASGRRWHHIIDPRSGFPADSGLISVTVLHSSAMTADALSTALFIAGIEAASGMIEAFPGAEVIMVDNRLNVFITEGLKGTYLANEGMEAIVI